MIHPNEIRITNDNRESLAALANALGSAYVEALKEQERRQKEN